MKLQNLSVRAFLRKIVAGTLLTAALLLLIFFLLTKDVRVVICGIILTAAFYIWGMVFLHYFQKKLSLFTDGLCQTLDHMMDSTDRPQVDYEAETLLSRISHRLERLYNVMQKTRHTAEGEKERTAIPSIRYFPPDQNPHRKFEADQRYHADTAIDRRKAQGVFAGHRYTAG